ncbi:ATP-binding protein [Deinococcus ficus]|uniref:histidine kinase n=1 Tax=Deinococcus ficus TaxID=317577 RepID=A0A221T1F0_9DEIO|nr:ATP-binding protein [Deinococcus ficus]ASN82714.1 hypothetical protein DFI_16285 [Deinococcus ficus]
MTAAPDVHLSPKQLQAVIDASGDCIKVLDLDARLLAMNRGGQQVMEVTDFQQCQHLLWTSVWDAEDRVRVEAALNAARAGETTTFEAPARTFAGTPKWWKVSVSPLRNDEGQLTHLLAISSDITARKAAEDAAQGELRRHASTLEQRVHQQTRALEAFAEFTTTAANSTDLRVLGEAATQILHNAVDGAFSGFYLMQGDAAVPLAFSANTPAAIIAAHEASVPVTTPVVAEAFRSGRTTVTIGDDGRALSAGHGGALSVTPYMTAGRPFAFLTAGVPRHVWTEPEQAIVASVGQGLGLALQRVRHAEELEERSIALDAFVNFTEAVGVETNLHRLAQQAMDVVQANIDDVSVGYYERDVAAGVWRGVVWSAELSPEIVEQVQAGVPLDAPDFAEAVRTGQPVFVEGWDAENNSLSEASAYGAAGFVPILIGGEAQAIFAVGKRVTQRWSARDQAIVRAVVRGLALAVERAVQAQQLTQQRDDLNRRAHELETLMQLTDNLTDSPDIPALIRRTQGLVLGLLPPGFAAYYEPQGGRWRLRAQTGPASSEALQTHMNAGFPLGQTASFDQVARSGQAAFVEVYDQGTDVDPDVARGVAAHATLPLMVGGRMRGLFNVPLFESRRWTAADQAVLVTAVQHLGVAIERIERTAQLAQSNAELQEANQELEAFTYSVSHDLRSPVRHVEGFATLARRELGQGNPDKAGRHLTVVAEAAERMNTLLDGMLTLSRAGRAVLNLQAVPVQRLIDQAQKDVTLLFPDRSVNWIVEAMPTIQGDAATLQQVVSHLLENAVKYSDGRGEVQVHVWVEERPQEWALFVRDTGVGFDPQYAGKLFSAFQRLHTQKEFAGAGIGLATVKRIVTRHGGRVWAHGSVGGGATFGFTIPKLVRLQQGA